MNGNGDEVKDEDCQGATAADTESRSQRLRNSLSANNNNSFISTNYHNRNNYQQLQQDLHQAQWNTHPPHRTNFCRMTQPIPSLPSHPPPPQWQYFRHRPFGESTLPHQFPRDPHFPHQFQFGTFPGRNSPRLGNVMDNAGVYSPNQSSVLPSTRSLHYQQDNLRDVRQRTGSFFNSKKKPTNRKYSRTEFFKRNKKKNVKADDLNPLPSHNENNCCSTTIGYDSCDKFEMKLSKSCDDTWLNETDAKETFDQVENLEMEGAVGGVPEMNNADRLGVLSDKDLIDEGAVFDLDKVFQNHEFSKNNSNNLSNNSGSDDDDLDFMLRCEDNCLYDSRLQTLSNTRHSDVDRISLMNISVNRETNRNSLEFVHVNVKKGAEACNIRNNDNNNNEREVLADSDGGEDTGDFIDTDLPSHSKHILSSSDEDNDVSSDRESGNSSDNEECFQSKEIKTKSDYYPNHASKADENFVNGLQNLNVHNPEERKLQHNRGVTNCNDCVYAMGFKLLESTNCDQCITKSSNVACQSDANRPKFNSCRLCLQSVHSCHSVEASHSPMQAAAAVLPINHTCNLNSRTFNHTGADSEIPILSECTHHITKNNLRTQQLTASKSNSMIQNDTQHATSGRRWSTHSYDYNHDSNACGGASTHEMEACCVSVDQSNLSSPNNGNSEFNNVDVEWENKGHPAMPMRKVNADIATSSASGAEKDLQEITCDHQNGMTSYNGDKVGSGMGGSGSNDSISNEQIDLVLLPMEEDIEPVYSFENVCNGDPAFNANEDVENIAPPGLPLPNSNNQPSASLSQSFDERLEPDLMDPVSRVNSMPSKEFYDVIKRVSATDSYMRFYDKDGQDVQRSAPRSCNDKENAKQHNKTSNSRGDAPKIDRVMIWNEYEAYVVQFKQIAVSACGQTAVLNVLKALKFPCEKSVVCKAITGNLRKEDKDVPEYLFSRACAGTTAIELMSGIEKLTNGTIGGRFFQFWPQRKVKLLQWLASWMKKGAIPMATLNLQLGPHSLWEVPDSWHHQMVYGVSHQGLYLTNPLEIVSERSAIKQLQSDSILLVRRQDIISRFKEGTNLGQLLEHPDPRWTSMNVLGQVVNILREYHMPSVSGYRPQVTSHIRIPASYEAGITLFMHKDQPAWKALLAAPQLPKCSNT